MESQNSIGKVYFIVKRSIGSIELDTLNDASLRWETRCECSESRQTLIMPCHWGTAFLIKPLGQKIFIGIV